MRTTLLRILFAALPFAMAGCASVEAGRQGSPDPGGAYSQVLLLARGQQVQAGAEPLSVRLVEINDSRCPPTVTCVWAGHATVDLLVDRKGQAPATLRIGTPSPAAQGLPSDASYAGYRVELLELERSDATGASATAASPRASIRVSRP